MAKEETSSGHPAHSTATEVDHRGQKKVNAASPSFEAGGEEETTTRRPKAKGPFPSCHSGQLPTRHALARVSGAPPAPTRKHVFTLSRGDENAEVEFAFVVAVETTPNANINVLQILLPINFKSALCSCLPSSLNPSLARWPHAVRLCPERLSASCCCSSSSSSSSSPKSCIRSTLSARSGVAAVPYGLIIIALEREEGMNERTAASLPAFNGWRIGGGGGKETSSCSQSRNHLILQTSRVVTNDK